MQSAIQALKDAVGGEDAEQIKPKTEALAQVAMKLGEAMYKAQQSAGGESGGGARTGCRQCRRAGRCCRQRQGR